MENEKEITGSKKNGSKVKPGSVILVIIIAIVSMFFGWLVADVSDDMYFVSFDIGSGANANFKVEENGKVLRPEDPKKDGYTFDGWYVNGKPFDFNTKITENLKLTAKWIKNQEIDETVTYTVVFDSNSGSTVASQLVEKDKTVVEPSNPTRSGYTFLGWYYNGSKFDFSTKITKSITITAKWEKQDVISYKIEEIPSSTLKQVRLYLTLNGKVVAGTADVINTQGQTIHVTVPASGLVKFVKGTIKSVTNIKVK